MTVHLSRPFPPAEWKRAETYCGLEGKQYLRRCYMATGGVPFTTDRRLWMTTCRSCKKAHKAELQPSADEP